MKKKAVIISCYALLIFLGGMIGHLVANSFASLIASSVSAFLLLSCAFFIWRGNARAFYIATFLITCLLVFFTYRFFLTHKLAPGGVMALISGALLTYFYLQRKHFVASLKNGS